MFGKNCWDNEGERKKKKCLGGRNCSQRGGEWGEGKRKKMFVYWVVRRLIARGKIGGGGKKKKKVNECEQKNPGIILTGLSTDAYSQALSHYCPARDLWPAAFQPWAGSVLIMQPGDPRLLEGHHIDAGLSADACST